MPLYDYRCQKCGEVTEFRHRYDEPGPTACPRCGGELVKLVSAPALQFKGSGFYITDYARSGAKQEGESKSESESKPESESKSESESKPAPAETKSEPAKESTPTPAKPANPPKSS
jgi:putative FmdB family regulatory protein